MKKALLTILAILLMVSMLTALASCGGSDSEGGNGILSGDKLPAGTDFNKKLGTRFEFTISAEAYFGTEYNAQGNPLIRRVYGLETMNQGVEPSSFVYEYDAKGVLKGYSVNVYPFSELTPLTLTYDENGRAVSGKATAGSEFVAASWEYDKNNLIVCETMELNGYFITFTYDDQGRIAKEAVYYGDSYSGECKNTYTNGGMHQLAVIDGETVVDADLTFDAEGYPLTVKGSIGGDAMEITYTYNGKKLCTSALVKGEDDSYRNEAVYNEKDLIISQTSTRYDEDGKQMHKSVQEYTYAQNGKIASETYSYYNENNLLEDKNSIRYEYDAKGNKTKEESAYYHGNEMKNRSVNTWTYNDKNQLIETTSVYYNDRDEVDEKSDTTFEYDAKGNCVKETYKTYDSDGMLDQTQISCYTYDDKNVCVSSEVKEYTEQNLLKIHEKREYDANGNMTKKISYRLDWDKENNVICNGRVEEIYSYDENGYVVKTQRIDYDADGNVVYTEDFFDKDFGGQMPRPEGDATDTEDSMDKNDMATETYPKEEKPQESLTDGSVSDNVGTAPEGDAMDESLAQAAPNAGVVEDENRTDNNRE